MWGDYTKSYTYSNICPKCSKPIYYVGDCFDESLVCQCGKKKVWEPYQNYGWICPICVSVLSPKERICTHNYKPGITVTWSQE